MDAEVRYGAASCRLLLGGPDFYFLMRLCTDPQHQGHGYASRLIEICKFIAKEDGKGLRLWVGKFAEGLSQDELFKFYGRHGFVRYDEDKPSYMEWRP